MDKENLFDLALVWAKKKGFSAIKANVEGYEAPTAFTKRGSEGDPIVPDITGKKLGTKSFLEISLKTDQVEDQVSKWKLLGTLAAARGGKLFLLAPKGHKAFTEKIVKEHSLFAQIVNLS